MRFFVLIVIGVFLDQLSKIWANHFLNFYTPKICVPHLFSLQLVHNFGAAYGILQHHRILLLSISFMVLVFGTLFFNRIAQTVLSRYALSFLLIGTAGNFLDRFIRGYVIDFMDIKIFPVFNFSDVCIDIAVVLFLIDIFYETRKRTH